MELFEVDELTISEWALREGIVLDAIGRHDPVDWSDDPRASGARVGAGAGAPVLVARGALAPGRRSSRLELFDQTRELHGLGDDDRELLEYAALLHDIGEHVSHDGPRPARRVPRRSTGSCAASTPRRSQLLAALVRWHRRGEPKATDELVGSSTTHATASAQLAALLRLADGLDRGRSRRGRRASTCASARHSSLLRLHDRRRPRARALGRPPQAGAVREGLRPRARAHRATPAGLTGRSD